ncbi:hypothetical protein BGZ72_008701, partial [Mortierella alpina]
RVQRILSTYNASGRTSKGNCFRYDHDCLVWTLNSSKAYDIANLQQGLCTPPSKKMASFQLSRNASMTTTNTTTTQTPSQSSLSVISSAVGSSLTAGIMEQVSTWRTGADTDDDDEASLEIYSNPSMHRLSFPSQVSRDESYASGGSLLNGMEIMPTLHQLQFPQPDNHGLFHQGADNDIMPPPSSTTSSYRRHSMSSHHQQRSAYGRIKRPSQDDNSGDQFVPTANRSSYHAMAADILSRSARPSDGRTQGGMATTTDRANESIFGHTPPNKSNFPSSRTNTPSPRVQAALPFGQPSQAGSMRGDPSESQHRQSANHAAPIRHSPNQFESPRLRQNRRSMDEVVDEDEPMLRETPRPVHAPSPRFTKEDPRLRDLGATLQKSLSFNGEEEYNDGEEEEELLADLEQTRARPGRHHPYLSRARAGSSSQAYPPGRRQPFDRAFRDRKGKGRANVREDEDQETIGKTPLLLNAINTSQTNILSELQNVQRFNQEELSHFREEIYQSLQVAFTTLSEQVEGVGRAVVSAEKAQQETVKQLGQSIGSAMGDVFSKMTESIQQQILQQYQQQQQQQQYQHFHPYPSRPSSIRHSSPFPAVPSQQIGQPGPSSGGYGGHTGFAGPRHSMHGTRESGSWKRDSDQPHDQDDDDEDEEDHGRGKRRAVERPRSTSGSRKTINRPRSEFDH